MLLPENEKMSDMAGDLGALPFAFGLVQLVAPDDPSEAPLSLEPFFF